MDQVYLKRYIKKDVPFEEHPNRIFGWFIIIGIIVWIALDYPIVCLNVDLHVPLWICAILWISIFAYGVYWVCSRNENCNLTKSSAFVIRDGKMYYIRLGFAGEPSTAIESPTSLGEAAAGAAANMDATKTIQGLRSDPQVYSDIVTKVLDTKKYKFPGCVHTFCPMNDARLEKVSKNYMWISFVPDKKWMSMAKDHRKDYKKKDKDGKEIKRAIMRIRRVYDIPLITEYEAKRAN